MHLAGALRQLAYRRSGRGSPALGDLQITYVAGPSANVVFAWPDGSNSKQIYGKAALTGNLPPLSKVVSNAVNGQYNSWVGVFGAPDPTGQLTASPVTYDNLPVTNVAAFQVPAFGAPVLQPHTTTAMNWLTGSAILNIGAPTALNDPYEYLRSALVDSDWNRVFAWYAYYIAYLWNNVGKDHGTFFSLSQFNLAQYKYVINSDGSKTYFPFSNGDLNQFFRLVQGKLKLVDTGRQTAVFGYLNANGTNPNPIRDADIYLGAGGDQAGGVTWPSSGIYGQTTNDPFINYHNDQKLTSAWPSRRSAYTALSLGWQRGPAGPWDFGQVFEIVLATVVSAGFASGIASALAAAPASSASTVPGLVGVTATAPTVTSGAVITASSSGVLAAATDAATAAGAFAAVATSIAPPIITATGVADASVVPIEGVTSTASALTSAATGVGTASVAAGLTSGAIVATAALAPISPATTANPNTPEDANTIETVTTTATNVPPAVIAATNAPIISGALAASSADALDTIAANQTVPTQNSNTLPSDVQDALQKLAASKGASYALSQLGALLGHAPSADEIAAANALLGGSTAGTDLLPWILIAGLGALMIFKAPKGHR